MTMAPQLSYWGIFGVQENFQRRSFGVASKQWGNSIQEPVESRRQKTDHNVSVSWTLALQSGLDPDEKPDFRIVWPKFSNSENDT